MIQRILLALLLLVTSLPLYGCGLAQGAFLSSYATTFEERLPDNADKEDILKASLKYPSGALLSPSFYKVATADDVARVLKKTSPTKLTRSVVRNRNNPGSILSGNFGSSLAQGIFLPVYKLETSAQDPLPIALTYSEHAEVIRLLADAGCPMEGRLAALLDGRPPFSGRERVTPELVTILLQYEPAPHSPSVLLAWLLLNDDERCPLETVKVFLEKAKNLNMHEDVGFAAFAVVGGSLSKLRLMLERGVNPNLKPNGWESPVVLAREKDRQDMVAALLVFGATPIRPTKK